MSQKHVTRILKSVERALNQEIPGTGARTRYVVLPGRGIHRRKLNRRAKQVLATLKRHHGATSAELQTLLKVNRNVISGAIWRLRQARVVRSTTVTA